MTVEWSIEDKRKFLVLLKKYGASDLETLHLNMPNKSIGEIRYMIDKYKKMAQERWSPTSGTNETVSWIEIIKRVNLSQQHPVQNILSRVFKYIALYEKKAEESDICLRDCYMFLSDVCNDKSPKELSERDGYLLKQCLEDMSTNLQGEYLYQTKKYFESINNFESLTSKREGSLLNPLNIPETLLQPNNQDIKAEL
ncbi:uncharacterized protein LOC132703784 [Cylas formicarius]|uniref:uncharacterized protein LOC132702985 n=1 Tax=Cylas formicarius TaxID=197179 RepID=UPI00295840CC|nr:uncharacterized protein LOC132702985 [Cylas formicarius]XP_060529238.1 uncharacterized protein LOC132703784 [Cylas formicarius]